MLGRQREGERSGAIVEILEGVADHQPQRPFSSLKESLLMVQSNAELLQLCKSVVFLSDCHADGWSGGSSEAMTSLSEVVLSIL